MINGSFVASPIATVGAIASAAAITVGLLALAGVGDEGPESQEERINRAAERLAVDIVRGQPEVCDLIDRVRNVTGGRANLLIGADTSYFAGVSTAERRAVSARLLEELRLQCAERSR